MTRRIVSGAALAVILAVALAGCVGIPDSGGVNVGPVVAGGANSSLGDLASRPPKNASKDVILTDFMSDATLPASDYAAAKLFLTTKAAQNWSPKSVLIREGSATTEDEPDGGLTYSVLTRASVGPDGTYVEQSTDSTQTLNFSFAKVNGQWRISQLADETVISSNSFSQVFAAYPLYFFDPGYHYLVPDIRWFPSGSIAQTRIANALLGGPADWLSGGAVVSAFPRAVTLNTVTVHGTAAVVDLSADAANSKDLDRARMLQQLEASLAAAGITGKVTMTAHGAPLTVTAQSSAQPAVAVNGSPLLQKGKQFGFYPRMEPLGKLGRVSTRIVALDGTAAILDRAQTSAAVLNKDGVYLVTGDTAAPLLVDSRPNLIAPSIDPYGYVWSVPSTDASAIVAVGADAVTHPIASALPSHSTIVSLDVSHDGTRLLVYLKTSAGPRLIVAGIIRRAGVPTSLGELFDLPVSSADPIDATWVDPSTVAALGLSGGEDTVISYVIGGAVSDPSTTDDGVHLVGGSDPDLLRLITSSGEIEELRSTGWQDIDVIASLLATQQ